MRKILFLLVLLLSISNLVEAGGIPAFKFTSNQDGSTIGFENLPDIVKLYYSTDGGVNWDPATSSTSITLNAGESVQFKGNNPNGLYDESLANIPPAYPGAPLPPQPETQFKITGDVSVSGNIAYLMSQSGSVMDLHEKNYYKLFKECDITDASGLILPSNVLAESCYAFMFYNCTKLTKAPELPATQLANSCYYFMFGGCNALTQAPELRATTLATSCYEDMFSNSGLTSAPELPATVMKDNCYYAMFSGCESLTEAPVLPATQLAYSCYYCMFSSCKALTQAPELPATQLADRCYFQMFGYCESLTHAPFLPATTLASECYKYIFEGCNNLEYVEVAFTDWGENDKYTRDWLYNTPSSGTFVCPESLDKSKTGSSGIPDGWKTQNYVDYLTFTSNKDGSEIVFCEFGSGVNLEYSTDRINWYSVGQNTKITLSKGKSVIFRGENAKGLKQTQFKITGDVSVSGDINTLINKTGGDIKLAGKCYQNLFLECNGLTDASKLKLPSTTLSAACYLNMFKDCSKLVYAPELPATTLASECYKSMFSGCSKLDLAPELPATTLATSCYESMFVGCKALKSAPVLPADELVDKCYGYMFDGCSSLNEIEVAFTEWKFSCTENWVRDVISKNGIFICPSELAKNFDESNIPEGWKIESPKPYLTFTSKEDGSTVGFVKISSVVSELYYRVDGSGWVDASNLLNNPVTLNNGNKIQFYGNNDNGLSIDIGDRTQFSVTGKVSVSGDLNTLMKDTVGDVDLVKCNYYYLFEDCKGITDASKLSLPSTTMKYKCYYGLFSGCSALTAAPELPATILAESCYYLMFNGCTSLTSAPYLPATTLAASCYYYMFSGCTSLTSAPYLPATTLAKGCYEKMFEDCSNLREIQVDFTSWGNSNTTDWVKNVSRTGVFICLNSLEQIIDNSHIPNGWVVENPLTFTSNQDASTIGFAQIASGAKIQYNDGTGWKDASELITNPLTLQSDEYVMFKGDYSGATLSISNYTQFAITGDVSASGDINSLIDGQGGDIKLENFNYYNLFKECAGLTDVSKLQLPSTTLANYCYVCMFLGCSALTSAPALPAKKLAVSCYENMYNGCLALTTAPELPATTLAEGCYFQMFKGCSKLKEITVAFTDWNSDEESTYEWVDGVASSGTFICPNSLSIETGTTRIPNGWAVNPEYLTFTSNQDGSTIGFVKIAEGAKIEYNDGTGWKDASELKTTPLTLNNGQFVKFRGDYNNVTTSKTVYTQFKIEGNVSASGDVNTLIDGKGGVIALNSYNYSRMFMECAGLTDASGLKLPSETMSESCCYQMFAACSALTKAPELEATQMATRCYQEMFNSCTSLTEAPNELPATNLADYCYADMFHSCSALLQGPTLPATVLSESCYSYMFYDCTSLLVAPALRATTLAKNCYKSMFKDCSSLFYVSISDCLSAFDNNYTSEWLSGVAPVGIFICRDITQVSDIKRGANYIPEGWYVGSYYVALSEDNINEGLSLSKSKYYNKDFEEMLAKLPSNQQMPDNYIDNMYSMDDTIKVNPENYEIDDMFYQSSPTADPVSVDYDKTNNTFAVSSLQNGQFVITISGSKLYQVKYYLNDMELGAEINQNDKTPIVFRNKATKSDLQSFSIDGCSPEIYTDAECTKLLGEDELLVSYCDNGLVKLYKKPIEYNITFDANGGSDIEPTTYTIEKNIDLSTIKAEKPYYDFVKWVDKNGTEVKQISKGSFGDITLKANYTPTQYSIIFDVNGGKPIEPFTYTIESETIDLSTIKAEKEGYHFVKWIDDKDAEVTQIVKGSNGNVALTAQFEAHSFGKWDTTLVATCTGYGLRTHVCACGVVETDTIPASEHKYELTEIIWSADSTSASATFTCEKGDATETVDGVITADTTVVPTVIAEGLLVYTATFIFNGEIYTDTHIQILDKAELTAVDDVQTNQVKVWGYNRVVYIENAEGVAQVFDINGRLVKSAEIYDAHSEFTLDRSGVYIVVVENKSYRICN